MLTIGFVGSGKSVHRYHLPFVLQREKFVVKTIYSPHAKNTKWTKRENINYTENEADLFDDSSVALIVVSTDVQTHFAYAKKALEKGKHVLVEKPFTKTVKEA